MQQVEREKFVEQFRARLGPEGLANALAELAKEENQSTMGRAQFNAYLLRNKIMLNKVEFDSIFERWEGVGGTADVLANFAFVRKRRGRGLVRCARAWATAMLRSTPT